MDIIKTTLEQRECESVESTVLVIETDEEHLEIPVYFTGLDEFEKQLYL